MQDAKKILLVEGSQDKRFFDKFIKDKTVAVKKPGNYVSGNGKTNALEALKIIIQDIRDEKITHLALIVDADDSNNPSGKDGYQNTLQSIKDIIGQYGYNIDNPAIISGGLAFSKDKYNDFGLWIMPDNHNDGYFEHLLKDTIIENKLFSHACEIVKAIPHKEPDKLRLFSESKVTKAKIATFMAWQKEPDQGYSAIFDVMDGVQIINIEHEKLQNLQNWLIHLYSQGTL